MGVPFHSSQTSSCLLLLDTKNQPQPAIYRRRCRVRVLTLMDDWMIQWSPKRHPRGWLVVNLVCLVASLALAANIVLFFRDDPELRPVGAALYLLYNFTTTLIWCVEIGLTAWEQQAEFSSSSSSWLSRLLRNTTWPVRLELIVAVYFFADSLHLLWKWRLTKNKLEAGLWDAMIGSVAYLYVAYDCWNVLRGRSAGGYVDIERGRGPPDAQSPLLFKTSPLEIPLATPG